jgi:RNA polymerase sigma-70 factor (ECF subfamily)
MADDQEKAGDRVLLEQLSRGNGSAFWVLWGKHQARVADVCRRQMSGVAADADDAMSRAMMQAQEKMPAYASSILNVDAWLARLSCNICFDIHRERCRDMRGTVNVDDEELADAALTAQESPESQCLASEISQRITDAIAELPAPLRDAARLRFVDEASYPEMAEKLSITVENARKRVQQSRSILRTVLKRADFR